MEQPEQLSDGESFSFVIPETFHGVRLDHFLAGELEDVSRSQITSAIKTGAILVNDKEVKAGYRLKKGDHIFGVLEVAGPEGPLLPQEINFDVLYEDESLVVINKPPGLVVHPGNGNKDRTLVNGLLYRFQDITGVGEQFRPGIVHRLDKDTSGVMVVARSITVQRKLIETFKNRRVEKRYLALVHGLPSPEGRVVAPIGRHPVVRQKMAVRQIEGRYAASSWRVLRTFSGTVLVEVTIETGRTHQIRVHMAHIGHPLAGDRLYGPNRDNGLFPRQMLHAWKLSFLHPQRKEQMAFEAPLAGDFARVLEELEGERCL